ncbi:MAG: response regulator [Phycisphaerales bacterium JB038]
MCSQNLTVLYVDDDQNCLDVMRTILESEGHAMLEARTAEQGLEILESQRPDAVIVDLMMEELDSGVMLIKNLRAKGDQLPVYMLSSVGDRLVQYVDAEALNITGIMQKPIRGDQILGVLRAMPREARG